MKDNHPTSSKQKLSIGSRSLQLLKCKSEQRYLQAISFTLILKNIVFNTKTHFVNNFKLQNNNGPAR